MVQVFESPLGFKSSIEARLRRYAESRGTTLQRERMLLIFDRLLARIDARFADAATLKGGLALERRLSRARTTKDVDLRMRGSPDALLAALQEAGRLSLGDFLDFEIAAHPERADMTGDGVRYEGLRFRVRCTLAGGPYGDPFGLDVAVGDPILGEPDVIRAPDHLGYMGVAPPSVRVYPVETRLAEKLHAYTMPRPRPNSRLKDLPDLALLALTGPLVADRVRSALHQTFAFRATHAVPRALPDPPEDWTRPYLRLAQENRLPWPDLPRLLAAVRRFLDPVLHGEATGRWSPEDWSWTPEPRASAE